MKYFLSIIFAIAVFFQFTGFVYADVKIQSSYDVYANDAFSQIAQVGAPPTLPPTLPPGDNPDPDDDPPPPPPPGDDPDPDEEEEIGGTGDYILLAPLPDTPSNPNFITYLNSVYRIIIGLAGVLAVLMIVIGGIEYIFSALPSAKSDAKSKITGAVLGLLLALTAWIILNTIDPNLLDIGIDLPKIGTGKLGDPPPPPPPPPSTWCYEIRKCSTCDVTYECRLTEDQCVNTAKIDCRIEGKSCPKGPLCQEYDANPGDPVWGFCAIENQGTTDTADDTYICEEGLTMQGCEDRLNEILDDPNTGVHEYCTSPAPEEPAPDFSDEEEEAARKTLTEAGVGIHPKVCDPTIHSGQPCSNSPCAIVSTLPQSAKNHIINLSTQLGSTNGDIVYITGGSEQCGHNGHGPNIGHIDLRRKDDNGLSKITKYIINHPDAIQGKAFSAGYTCYKINGTTYVRETNPDHWHVEVGETSHCN